jgi:hypothetical protein
MKYLNFANPVSGNRQPEFLMTLIDLSPSMDDKDWKPSRKAGALKANIELIKAKVKYHPQDKLGIIGFSRHARLLHDPVCLRDSTESLLKALKNPSGGYSTNFTVALELAEECLFRRKRKLANKFFSKVLSGIFYEPEQNHVKPTNPYNNRAGDLKRIILLTDGEHNTGFCPLKVATRLKNAGVLIDCIGIGGRPKDVDEKLLKKIASRDRNGSIRYCFIGNKQSLLRKYETLARHIRP